MLWRAVRYVNAQASLQLRVLRLGFLQNGDVGVGVFPEGEEVLVRALCFCTVGCHRVGTSELKTRQRSRPAVPDDPAVVENLLKLGGGGRCPVRLPSMSHPSSREIWVRRQYFLALSSLCTRRAEQVSAAIRKRLSRPVYLCTPCHSPQ